MIIISKGTDTSEKSQTLTNSFYWHDQNRVCKTQKSTLMGLSYTGRLLGIARFLIMEHPSTDAFLTPLSIQFGTYYFSTKLLKCFSVFHF